MSRSRHVVPRNDLLEHEVDDLMACPCGPTVEHVPNPVKGDGWLVIHHSLDGRERQEQQ